MEVATQPSCENQYPGSVVSLVMFYRKDPPTHFKFKPTSTSTYLFEFSIVDNSVSPLRPIDLLQEFVSKYFPTLRQF